MILACHTKKESSDTGLAEHPSGGSVLIAFKSVINLNCALLVDGDDMFPDYIKIILYTRCTDQHVSFPGVYVSNLLSFPVSDVH